KLCRSAPSGYVQQQSVAYPQAFREVPLLAVNFCHVRLPPVVTSSPELTDPALVPRRDVILSPIDLFEVCLTKRASQPNIRARTSFWPFGIEFCCLMRS